MGNDEKMKSSIPTLRDRGFFLTAEAWTKDMKLRVNGEGYETEKETVLQLLGELGIMPERVAVEVNLEVIKKAGYEQCRLHDGDSVEIVYFVGGGQYREERKLQDRGRNTRWRREYGR
jgi:sulfur carrier protein